MAVKSVQVDNASITSTAEPHQAVDIETTHMSRMVVILTLMTSLCGFMFGYDTGYISGALVVIRQDLGKSLTSADKEMITAAASLGALIASFFGGALSDWLGRKWVILGSNFLFVLGTALQISSHSTWRMIGGRFVMGWGIGIASLVAPLYISELVPSRFRGRMIVINVMACTFGQLVAYAIGAAFNKVDSGWRYIVGLALVPSVIQMACFVFMPETPRFLIRKRRFDDARKLLKLIYVDAPEDMIEAKIQELDMFNKFAVGFENLSAPARIARSVKELHTVGSNFRALIISCGLQGIQQFCGWNSLMYFSATIFQQVGFSNPTAVSIIISGTNFVFTGLAFMVIDRIGRRRLLLSTVWGMALGLMLCAIAFHFLPSAGKMTSDDSSTDTPKGWAILVIISMLIYAAFYASGIGNVPWQQSELFPISVRAMGSSIATAVNWTGNLVISSTFLTMLEKVTPTGTFAFYGGLCIIGEIFVYLFYPETANLNLEEVQQLLTGGFNIKLSYQMSNQAKAARQNTHSKA